MNRYSIYPSLLDGFAYYQSIDDYDLRKAKEQELIDSINRVPHPPIEVASRGTALNEIVDSIIEARKPTINYRYNDGCYICDIDGFQFCFSNKIVYSLIEELYDCCCQVLTKAEIEIPQGIVSLYGYADYVRDGEVIDLKTTNHYSVGKYRDHWQHYVYPYCLTKSGNMSDISQFYYLVAELHTDRATDLIDAEFYTEYYPFNFKDAENSLRNFLSLEFIPFLEDHREVITDKKIFT